MHPGIREAANAEIPVILGSMDEYTISTIELALEKISAELSALK